jgi:hypothetical protein
LARGASLIQESTIMKDEAPRPSLAKLPGKEFVNIDEPTLNAPLDEGLVKALTGGEPVEVRRITEPMPAPRFPDGSGVWRRILLTPWPPQPAGTASLFRPLSRRERLRIALRRVVQRVRRLLGLPEPKVRPSLRVLPGKRLPFGMAIDWTAANADVSLATCRCVDGDAHRSRDRE